MKYSILLISAAIFAVNACNTKQASKETETQKHAEHDGDHIFACPMHPEVTGKEGDKCPKCGMDLEHNDNAGKSDGNTYKMAFTSNPATIEAGKQTVLSLTPKIEGKEKEQVPLDVEHEKKIHFIMVSNDLGWFDHQHPEYNATGSYDLPYTFQSGGNYILFADYKPTGGAHQVEKITVNVNGSPSKTSKWTESRIVSKVDGYVVKFINGNEMKSGIMGHINISIEKDGKSIKPDELEKYLGANAHIVMIGEEDKEYLHVHPEAEEFPIHAHTMVSKPGIYRMWVQFQTNGKVHTADFVIIVGDGRGKTKGDDMKGMKH
ncbi:MAG: heavy metal-binding domain-containing protein [Bacteroidia bacterium]